MAPGPLHITGHNSTHLAVWGLGGLGIKSAERPNGRRNDQLRALPTRSPQENISGADPGNHEDPLATEQEAEGRGRGRGRERERERERLFYRYIDCLGRVVYHTVTGYLFNNQ